MYKQSIFYIALVLLSTSLHATGQIPTLQELCAQRVVKKDVLDSVADLPQHFKDIGIDDDNVDNQLTLTPKVKQTFIDTIRERFGQELSHRTLAGHDRGYYQ